MLPLPPTPGPGRGFTFPEVLMAVLVVGLALLPLLWFFASSHVSVRSSIGEVWADTLASEVIEAVQALPFETLGDYQGPLAPAAFARAAAAGFPVPLPNVRPGYKCDLNISAIECERLIPDTLPVPVRERAVQASRLFDVTVTVTWTEKGGRQQSIALSTVRGST